MVTDQIDPDTDEILCNFGVYNDEDGFYKKMQNENTIHNAMYIMKANQTLNSEMYSYAQAQMFNGRVKFLIDENLAKGKLLTTEKGKKMTPNQRADALMPYVKTSALKEEMMNLIQNQDGALIILKQENPKTPKDKFSAFVYGMYYCKMMEDKTRRKRGRDLSGMMLFTSSGKNR